MTPKYRKTDPADSDFLDEQGSAYFNHGLRKWLHSASRPGIIIFPDPASIAPTDD
jgi:hypothetical protein